MSGIWTRSGSVTRCERWHAGEGTHTHMKRFSCCELMSKTGASEMRHAAREVSFTMCQILVSSKLIFFFYLLKHLTHFLVLTWHELGDKAAAEHNKCPGVNFWTLNRFLSRSGQTSNSLSRLPATPRSHLCSAYMEIFWLFARGINKMIILTRLKGDMSRPGILSSHNWSQ